MAAAAAASLREPPHVEELRARTRRRLIGAFVLVVVAVLTLPALLDSPPRRLDRDARLDLPVPSGPAMPGGSVAAAAPAGSGVASPVLGAAAVGGVAAGVAAAQAARPTGQAVAANAGSNPSVPPAPKIASADAGARTPSSRPAAVAQAPARVTSPAAAPQPRPQAAAKMPERPAKADARPDRSEKTPVRSAEKPADKSGGKVWLQVGAYSESATVRSVRQRIDKAGLHSVEQPVSTSAGPRTRVRLGPFASKEEADKALARLRAAGLAATAVAP